MGQLTQHGSGTVKFKSETQGRHGRYLHHGWAPQPILLLSAACCVPLACTHGLVISLKALSQIGCFQRNWIFFVAAWMREVSKVL
ncbi:hypothetical protein ASPTUDRAFT_49015 [Aspergillus tubingensis CBS 134.48]|uniref:Uncharacterized protein n=1 Tax=Aspergillus tubingensis (strain CBS 134.48) TaxID=767770 RepID=A0A1L9NJP3_ASPTC|nr:hypothetical protein ASPTUDRAFT_49015 [Aspergillus tubingensis CBS 134.48]